MPSRLYAMAADKMKKAGKAGKERRGPGAGALSGIQGPLLLVLRAIAALSVFTIGHTISSHGFAASEANEKMSIWARLIFFVLAQAMANELFALLMLQVARRLLGEDLPFGAEWTQEERAVNDPNIVWPPKDLLSEPLRKFADRKGQPFFLNHVTGKRRFKDACMRFGMTIGTVLTVWCTCRWMDMRSLPELGLTLDQPFWSEACVGVCVGAFIVTFIFFVELGMGWIDVLSFFEVFDRSENFARCIFYDVVFHLNVALNEELPVRGWMLVNLAESVHTQIGLSSVASFIVALVVESLFFVAMHLKSPGGTELRSMINIFIGGISGGLNVLCTGGRLGFAIGWHFGWNITMGNVFGLSTSGIPISATFVSVAPHPEKQHLHGGVFGPEGGLVSPFAYGLGIALVLLVYGIPVEGLQVVS